jgi:hypothetical protein
MYNADLAILPVAILGLVAFVVGLYFTRKERRDRHAVGPADEPRSH